MQIVIALLLLAFLLGYVVPNIIRYPLHALVFLVVGAGLVYLSGGGERLMARLKASSHPVARRYLVAHTLFFSILQGVPPYNAGRWWLVRTLVQGVFWVAALALALAVIVATGGVFHWLDTK
jgi:hypothetical protein